MSPNPTGALRESRTPEVTLAEARWPGLCIPIHSILGISRDTWSAPCGSARGPGTGDRMDIAPSFTSPVDTKGPTSGVGSALRAREEDVPQPLAASRVRVAQPRRQDEAPCTGSRAVTPPSPIGQRGNTSYRRHILVVSLSPLSRSAPSSIWGRGSRE